MPYSDDDIIRNGTLRQWLNYRVKPHALRGWWILLAVLLAGFIIGKLV